MKICSVLICLSNFLTVPAVPNNFGSKDIEILYLCLCLLICFSTFSAKYDVLIIIFVKFLWPTSMSIQRSNIGVPFTGIKHFGVESVCGLSLLPSPAANKIALNSLVINIFSSVCDIYRILGFQRKSAQTWKKITHINLEKKK